MVGVLIVTHGNFGKEILRSSELIIGEQENVRTISLNLGDDVNEFSRNINEQIEQLDEGEGVLVLTDLFGGSPSNITAASMRDETIEGTNFECLSGVNLAMVIEALNSRTNINLTNLMYQVFEAGVAGIKNIRSELQLSNSIGI